MIKLTYCLRRKPAMTLEEFQRYWREIHDSLDALARDDPSAARAGAELLDDERNFIDLANSPMWIAEEHVVIA